MAAYTTKEAALAYLSSEDQDTCLEEVSEALRDDKEVVLAAVQKRREFGGSCLEYASEALRNDPDVVMAALRHRSDAMEYASEDLKNNKEVAMAGLQACAEKTFPLTPENRWMIGIDAHTILDNVSEELQRELYASKEAMLLALGPESSDDSSVILDDISEELRADKDVILRALSCPSYNDDGQAVLELASEELQRDAEVLAAHALCRDVLKAKGEAADKAATLEEAKANALAAVEEQLGGTLDAAGIERFRAFIVEAFDPENPHGLNDGCGLNLEPEEAVEQAVKLVRSLATGGKFKGKQLGDISYERSTELKLALMMGGAVVSKLLTVENMRGPLTSWSLDAVNEGLQISDVVDAIELLPDDVFASHAAAALKHATSILSSDCDYDELDFFKGGGLHEDMPSGYEYLMSRLVKRCAPSVLDAHISWILSVARDNDYLALNLLSACPKDALKRSAPEIVALASAEECSHLQEVLPGANGVDIARVLGFSILDVIELLEPAQLSGCVPTLLFLLKHPTVDPSRVAAWLRQCDPQSLLTHQAALGEMQVAPHRPEVIAVADELMSALFAPPLPGRGASSSGAGFEQAAANTLVGKKRPASED